MDIAKVKALMARPERKKRAKTLERTYPVWWDLPTTLAKCSNEDCLAPDPDRQQMTATLGGFTMCRHCFLAGYGPEDGTPLDIPPRAW